jgi:hypothetical protein
MPDVRWSAACLAVSLAGGSLCSAQVSLGTVDSFEDGTIMNWLGATRTNAQGGPGGASDRYLRLDNGGTGNKVAMFNAEARWVGDYRGAGVSGISVDLNNFGPATMEIRLVLFGATSTGGGRWTSTSAAVLPANSGWRSFTFPVAQSSLTSVFGAVPYDSLIGNVTQIMFRHDPGTPSAGGATGDGLVGFDNIRAVPAPGTAAALLGAGMVLAARRRR